jgi:hypothetical protein
MAPEESRSGDSRNSHASEHGSQGRKSFLRPRLPVHIYLAPRKHSAASVGCFLLQSGLAVKSADRALSQELPNAPSDPESWRGKAILSGNPAHMSTAYNLQDSTAPVPVCWRRQSVTSLANQLWRKQAIRFFTLNF